VPKTFEIEPQKDRFFWFSLLYFKSHPPCFNFSSTFYIFFRVGKLPVDLKEVFFTQLFSAVIFRFLLKTEKFRVLMK